MRRLRRQVFRQIVQARRRRANARQGELVQSDGKYAGKMRAKRESRVLCGVALDKVLHIQADCLLPLHSAHGLSMCWFSIK